MRAQGPRAFARPLAGLAVAVTIASLSLTQLASRAAIAPTDVTLNPSLPSGQLVGAPITWTSGASAASPIYRFSVARGDDPFRVVRDYRPASNFTWTPMAEGTYHIKVTVRDGFGSSESTELVADYDVQSRVSGSTPVVTPTANTLVALYSAPPCAAGSLSVAFRPTGTTRWDVTNAVPCRPGVSVNLYVGGMRANSAYDIVHFVVNSSARVNGPLMSFTTGTPPALPTSSVTLAPDPVLSSAADDVIVHSLASTLPGSTIWGYATDLAGRPVWYYDAGPNGAPLRPLTGGTMLLQAPEAALRGQLLREVDLAGNTLRETGVTRLNEQLTAMGHQNIIAIHHDALRTPGGLTVVMGFTERLFTDVQGAVGDVDVLGDSLIALDQDWQVVWEWDAFDHLDINRAATLDDKCRADNPLCPPLQLAPIANDWLHANSLDLTSDGHLLISLRNQDWIIKIDFANGTGTGNVLWRLGKDGDFSLESADPYPWLSHAHSVSVVSPTQIAVFDNGNVRCVGAGPECHSRGQMYVIDEIQRQATLALNVDLGSYSNAWGAAFRLSNGNLGFNSGKQKTLQGGFFADTIEVLPSSATVYDLRTIAPMYRVFRMKNLYLR